VEAETIYPRVKRPGFTEESGLVKSEKYFATLAEIPGGSPEEFPASIGRISKGFPLVKWGGNAPVFQT